MELNQLRHFLAVADSGGFSRAAENLSISQPALSKSIKLLELDLGVLLFERKSDGVRLTRYGIRLVDRARSILRAVEVTSSEFSSLNTGPIQEAFIGVTENFNNYLFPRAIDTVQAEIPNIELFIYSELYESCVTRLLKGETDFVFGVFSQTFQEATLEFEELLPVEAHVYARPDHPAFSSNKTSRKELADHSWAMLGQAAMTRIINYSFIAHGVNAPRAAFEVNSMQLQKQLLLDTRVVGLLPDHYVEPEIQSGALKALNCPELEFKGVCGIIRRRRTQLSATSEIVCQALRKVCNEEAADKVENA